MSIDFTILGILSYKPLTGYDLKKIIQDTSFMPWSGNNNQIYKALLELSKKGYVTSQVMHQEQSPSKKIYTVTGAGLSALGEWSKATPEVFESKKPFLLQLAWSDLLNRDELAKLFNSYEEEITGQLLMEKAKQKEGFFSKGRTKRETKIWSLINTNIISTYEHELDWIKQAGKELLS